MKALILAPFDPQSIACLEQMGIAVTYENWRETGRLADPEELGARLAAEDFSILVIEADFVFEETFAAAPDLRLVAVARGDVGPHVDLDAAEQAGVQVLHTPGRNAVAVAELTVGLALALLRRVPQAHALVSGGRWDSALLATEWGGHELSGKTFGLIGLGAVGRQVARRLAGFDVNLLAYDPYAEPAGDVELLALDELLARSDVVSVHCTVTPETTRLLDAAQLARMKRGAWLINTARSAIVDETALVDALRSGHLAGAALDVFDVEPLPPDHPLLHLDNVVLTPHLGGAAVEIVRHHSEMIVEGIREWRRGG